MHEEFGYQIVQLNRGNTLVNTRDNLLCDSSGVNMVPVKSVT